MRFAAGRSPLWLFLICIPILIAVALWYAGDRGIPQRVALAALPAFLLEAVLYVLSGLRPVRDRLSRAPQWSVALGLVALAPVSWLLLALPLGAFDAGHLLAILGLAAVAACWHLLLPRNAATDLLFLAVVAAPVLLKYFNVLYPNPAPKVPGGIVGALMWYRTMLIAILCIRRMEGVNFGFLPQRREWRIGVLHYLLFLPVGFALAVWIGFGRLKPNLIWDGRLLLLAALTFIGALWVIALSEEFFFRGLLQQHLSRLFRNPAAGLLLASVLFGLAHLWFAGKFPNWKMALLASVAGVFYGRAYQQAGSIRAAMVTHALVVTTWRTFLS